MELSSVLYLFLGVVLGGIIGAFLMFRWFKKYLQKNPPINERQIKEMFRQMGRTPSEKQIRQIVNSMKQAK
ncbi:YneF family protein [Candidatus Phytoplasma meliae]|uniref:YneF family protein n=1 Tax=Candidatus Phytoplasma meliae TaxID=1848402 RepID=A0ABS5CZ63_9MOLU|nr:YneF family protein [Candidatus Phytoplasma meliae]MBP5836156.1 YneF family protein [Candidatus Phytoplasma meliae]MBP5836259.1 YneF family protein [Candidatus Phytoplasma meliae]